MMSYSLASHRHIEAREDVLREVDGGRGFGQGAPVGGPEAVQEVRVPVVHP